MPRVHLIVYMLELAEITNSKGLPNFHSQLYYHNVNFKISQLMCRIVVFVPVLCLAINKHSSFRFKPYETHRMKN